MEKNKEARRFVAKIKTITGSNGEFRSVMVNNPNPKDSEGNPDPYFKGSLLWLDKETGKKYMVKQLGVGSFKEAKNGFKDYIYLDLDDPYHVSDLG